MENRRQKKNRKRKSKLSRMETMQHDDKQSKCIACEKLHDNDLILCQECLNQRIHKSMELADKFWGIKQASVVDSPVTCSSRETKNITDGGRKKETIASLEDMPETPETKEPVTKEKQGLRNSIQPGLHTADSASLDDESVKITKSHNKYWKQKSCLRMSSSMYEEPTRQLSAAQQRPYAKNQDERSNSMYEKSTKKIHVPPSPQIQGFRNECMDSEYEETSNQINLPKPTPPVKRVENAKHQAAMLASSDEIPEDMFSSFSLMSPWKPPRYNTAVHSRNLTTYKGRSIITDVLILENDDIALADSYQKRVLILDRDSFEEKRQIDLSSEPSSLANVPGGRLAIALPEEKQIRILNLLQSDGFKQVIFTKGGWYGMVYCKWWMAPSGESLIGCEHRALFQNHIIQVDLVAGYELRELYICRTTVYHMALSADMEKLYMSHKQANSLSILWFNDLPKPVMINMFFASVKNYDSSRLTEFKELGMPTSSGFAIDNHGDVYLANCKKNNVYQLNSNLDKIKEFGIFVKGAEHLVYRDYDKSLMVLCDRRDTLMVFKLS